MVTSPSLTGPAVISAAKRPASIAAIARSWLRSANASLSARVMPSRAATSSAVSPMLSVIRRSSGRAAGGLVVLREPRVGEAPAQRRVDHLAGARPRGAGLCITQGARVIDSTPPATIRSASPARTALGGRDDRGQAARAEPVDRVAGDGVGQAGQQHGHPGDVAVVLAGLVGGAEDDLVDRPRPGTPAAATASRTTSAARSSGRTPASAPPYLPCGVRTPPTRKASGIGCLPRPGGGDGTAG